MWEFRDSGTNPLESTNTCPGTCPRILCVAESETELLFLSTKGAEAEFEKRVKRQNAETTRAFIDDFAKSAETKRRNVAET